MRPSGGLDRLIAIGQIWVGVLLPILRNRFSHPGPGHQADQAPTYPAADSSAQAVRPCPPMTHWQKHHARLSTVQRCASAFPWAYRLPRLLSRLPIQAAAEWCPPAASLDHRPFPAGIHRPACDSAGTRRRNRHRESPHAARILAPGRETTPAAHPGCRPSNPDKPGIPSAATRHRCFGFGSSGSRARLPSVSGSMPPFRRRVASSIRRPRLVSAGHPVAAAEYPAPAYRLSCPFRLGIAARFLCHPFFSRSDFA